MNLLELSEQEQEWIAALTHVSESGEPISEEEQARIIEAYIAADEQFKDKVERYCQLIEAFAARAVYRAEQAKNVQKLAKQDQNISDKLIKRILFVMQVRGEKRIETALYAPHIVGNGGKAPTVIPDAWRTNPRLAPKEFQKEVVELDLLKIRQKLDAGQTVEGCKIGERGVRLALR